MLIVLSCGVGAASCVCFCGLLLCCGFLAMRFVVYCIVALAYVMVLFGVGVVVLWFLAVVACGGLL